MSWSNNQKLARKSMATPKRQYPEQALQKWGDGYLRARGCVPITMRTTGIYVGMSRHKQPMFKDNPAIGCPDSLVFWLSQGIMFWIEYKDGDKGVVSQAQALFHKLLRDCGQVVLVIRHKWQLMEFFEDPAAALEKEIAKPRRATRKKSEAAA